jgi:hypothetical protein
LLSRKSRKVRGTIMDKCKCGGKIIFEKKKTFVIPSTKQGVCLKCGRQYILVDGILKEKGVD